MLGLTYCCRCQQVLTTKNLHGEPAIFSRQTPLILCQPPDLGGVPLLLAYYPLSLGVSPLLHSIGGFYEQVAQNAGVLPTEPSGTKARNSNNNKQYARAPDLHTSISSSASPELRTSVPPPRRYTSSAPP